MVRLGKIVYPISKVGECKLNLVVFFPKDKPVIGKKVYSDEMTVYLNVSGFVTIEFFSNQKNQITSIFLGQYQKHLFILTMKKMCSILQKKNVFYYDEESGELKIYSNTNEDGSSKWLIKSQIGKNMIALHPIVVYPDLNSKGIEGIRIMVNSSDNCVDMSYEDSIILIEMLKDVNISILSNMIIGSVLPSYVNKLVDSSEVNEASSKLDVLDESTSFNKRIEVINSEKEDESSAIGKVAKDYREKIERRSIRNGEKERIETSDLSGNENH